MTLADRIGHWKARWGIGRMNFKVAPGLYSLGKPDDSSHVVVSANYRLSFDLLRQSLSGRDFWILVLDTDGINVWCAAGKGTFGTDELLHRISGTGLSDVVSHRRLIVPQLGAVGVAAHEVRKHSGFKVVYGPVRAEDLPAFLDAGQKAAPSMRRVTFTMRERAILVPMELVPALRWTLPVIAALGLASGAGSTGYSIEAAWKNGQLLAAGGLGALAAGAVVTPLLLPWLPGRAFSVKGALVGLVWTLVFLLSGGADPALTFSWRHLAFFLALPAVSAFFAMNFTGSTVMTSYSGVKKEMRFALPFQAIGAIGGGLAWFGSLFAKGVV